MKTPTNLHNEVENAGQRYDQAVEKVFAVLEKPDTPPTDVLDATQTLKQTLHLYAAALKRMAAHA